jgi:hypothetical protein
MSVVKGSLQRHLPWWRDNVINESIVNIVAVGYRLPLFKIPEPSEIKNNKSARDNPKFIDSELESLLNTGVIKLVREKPTVVNALSVASNAKGKLRLVLDLRHVNPILNVSKFKYEDIKAASTYFSVDGWMASFDLKSGYRHIDIHQSYHTYLGFAWNNNYYVYTTCPFGLAVAGLVFSKVLRELVKIWRAQGIAVVLYLDDGFITSSNVHSTRMAVNIIQRDLRLAGFIVNSEKSIWDPTQCLQCLGFILNSKDNVFTVPEDKLDRLRHQLQRVLRYQASCSARDVAKVIGKLCSLYHAYGPIVYMMTKCCSMWVSDRESWSEWGALSENGIGELEFWLKNLDRMIQMPLVPVHPSHDVKIYSDASDTGCGAFVEGKNSFNMIHQWSTTESEASSTWREIKAIAIFLEIHVVKFQHKHLKWYSDNAGVTSIIKKGSMKKDLNNVALDIYALCIQHGIHLLVDWVPRNQNQLADDLSKQPDWDDWGIHTRIFRFLNSTYGPFTIDVYASNVTKKLPRFYSKYWCGGTLGVDGLAFDWGGEVCWCIIHARACSAKGVLVIPKWKSALFWPLVNDGTQWVPGFSLLVEYRKPANFFVHCQYGNDMFTEKPFSGSVVVLKVDFSQLW